MSIQSNIMGHDVSCLSMGAQIAFQRRDVCADDVVRKPQNIAILRISPRSLALGSADGWLTVLYATSERLGRPSPVITASSIARQVGLK